MKNKLSWLFSIGYNLPRFIYHVWMINLFLFLFLLLLNEFFLGLVSAAVLSVNLLLIIIFGGLSVLFPLNSVYKIEKKLLNRDYLFIVLLGTLFGYLTFLNIAFSTGMAYLLGFLVLVITIILFGGVIRMVNRKKNL